MTFSNPQQHPPRARGSLFNNDRRTSDSAPEYTGPGSISREAIQALMDAYQGEGLMDEQTGELRVRLAAWKKVSSNGRPYLFVTIEPHMPPPEQAAAPAAAGSDGFLDF